VAVEYIPVPVASSAALDASTGDAPPIAFPPPPLPLNAGAGQQVRCASSASACDAAPLAVQWGGAAGATPGLSRAPSSASACDAAPLHLQQPVISFSSGVAPGPLPPLRPASAASPGGDVLSPLMQHAPGGGGGAHGHGHGLRPGTSVGAYEARQLHGGYSYGGGAAVVGPGSGRPHFLRPASAAAAYDATAAAVVAAKLAERRARLSISEGDEGAATPPHAASGAAVSAAAAAALAAVASAAAAAGGGGGVPANAVPLKGVGLSTLLTADATGRPLAAVSGTHAN
jgi:hypothetical protein